MLARRDKIYSAAEPLPARVDSLAQLHGAVQYVLAVARVQCELALVRRKATARRGTRYRVRCAAPT